ncbi:MAG: hypothetical protein FWG63_04345 [Defluviitaleaceae bacterium]|nr:hypothetical protein [Defluviitaleaceae bacterium]
MYKEYAQKVLYEIGKRHAEGTGEEPKLNRESWKHTGIRFIPIIEKEIGRKITEKEWYDLSIR